MAAPASAERGAVPGDAARGEGTCGQPAAVERALSRGWRTISPRRCRSSPRPATTSWRGDARELRGEHRPGPAAAADRGRRPGARRADRRGRVRTRSRAARDHAPVLLRSYRVGHGWLWDRWSQALHDRIGDPQELVAAQDQSSAFMFAYIDRISAPGGGVRDRARADGARRGAAAGRNGAGDPCRRGDRRGGRRPPARLRAAPAPCRAAGVGHRRRGSRARARGRRRRRRSVRANRWWCRAAASLDVWWGAFQPVGPMRWRATSRRPDPCRVRRARAGYRRVSPLPRGGGAGGAGRGARGSVPGGHGPPSLGLVSLLAGDLPRARRFVSAQLGPLASSAEPAARLRETVLAFLVAGGSGTRVAKELYVHQNTVAYRVRRAEELMGRPVSVSPVELTCALTLAAALGSHAEGRRRRRREQALGTWVRTTPIIPTYQATITASRVRPGGGPRADPSSCRSNDRGRWSGIASPGWG